MIKPDKETMEIMIDKFEQEKMVAQCCIFALQSELRKLEETNSAPNSPQKASEQMDSKAEGISGVQDSHIPEDNIHIKIEKEMNK